jgi:hypothetical protein
MHNVEVVSSHAVCAKELTWMGLVDHKPRSCPFEEHEVYVAIVVVPHLDEPPIVENPIHSLSKP